MGTRGARPGRGGAAPPEQLTSVVLHVIHRHVGGHEGRLTVLLLVLLLCQETGLGILRGNDIFDFSTMGREEPCHVLDPRTSGPHQELTGESSSPPVQKGTVFPGAQWCSYQLPYSPIRRQLPLLLEMWGEETEPEK